MAMQAAAYVREHTQVTIMVILAGSGHARKLGIPTQLEKLGLHSYAGGIAGDTGHFRYLSC